MCHCLAGRGGANLAGAEGSGGGDESGIFQLWVRRFFLKPCHSGTDFLLRTMVNWFMKVSRSAWHAMNMSLHLGPDLGGNKKSRADSARLEETGFGWIGNGELTKNCESHLNKWTTVLPLPAMLFSLPAERMHWYSFCHHKKTKRFAGHNGGSSCFFTTSPGMNHLKIPNGKVMRHLEKSPGAAQQRAERAQERSVQETWTSQGTAGLKRYP